jgi:hypothetical protein
MYDNNHTKVMLPLGTYFIFIESHGTTYAYIVSHAPSEKKNSATVYGIDGTVNVANVLDGNTMPRSIIDDDCG